MRLGAEGGEGRGEEPKEKELQKYQPALCQILNAMIKHIFSTSF